MSINKHQNAKALIISTLNSVEFSMLKDNRKQFILNVFLCFLSIKGRINFLQLSRFSKHGCFAAYFPPIALEIVTEFFCFDFHAFLRNEVVSYRNNIRRRKKNASDLLLEALFVYSIFSPFISTTFTLFFETFKTISFFGWVSSFSIFKFKMFFFVYIRG